MSEDAGKAELVNTGRDLFITKQAYGPITVDDAFQKAHALGLRLPTPEEAITVTRALEYSGPASRLSIAFKSNSGPLFAFPDSDPAQAPVEIDKASGEAKPASLEDTGFFRFVQKPTEKPHTGLHWGHE